MLGRLLCSAAKARMCGGQEAGWGVPGGVKLHFLRTAYEYAAVSLCAACARVTLLPFPPASQCTGTRTHARAHAHACTHTHTRPNRSSIPQGRLA